MKPDKKSHIEFCQAVADGSTYKDAYKTYVSPKKSLSDQSAEVEGSKMAKRYAIHIQGLRERAADAVLLANENESVINALKRVLTVTEVDGILSEMIKKKDARAVDIYYKRFGHYAPTKIAPTNKDGEDLEQKLSETDVDRILEKIEALKTKE